MFERADLDLDDNGEPADVPREADARRERRLPADALLAILVTDLEGFTPLVQRLGDEAAQRVMRTHDRILRDCLAAQAGDEIAHTGDGVLAAFRSVVRALTCAGEIQNTLRRYNRNHEQAPLRVRIGIHAGEPLPQDDRLFGSCVITAVRICSAAEAERVLVSDLVWQLAAGRSFEFRQHGCVELKGLHKPVQLHELRWRRTRTGA
jgi:class 3 adenylate cyclase